MRLKIAIDPGHGMSNATPNVYDPGAISKVQGITYAEADIALRFGLTLKRLCEEREIEFFMTRSSSADPAPVGLRAARSTRAGCTRLISFHLNQFKDPNSNGIEVLYRDVAKDKLFADVVQNAIVGITPLRKRENKQRLNLAVLRFAPGPAILIELGFISNDGDRNYLLVTENRDAICNKILEVVQASV